MTVFFSPYADVMLAVLGIALILAGTCCILLSRETSRADGHSPWLYVGVALVLLSLREWLGLIGLSAPRFTALVPVTAFLQGLAAASVLAAAHREAAGDRTGQILTRVVALTMLATLLLFLMLGGRYAWVGIFYLIKASMFLAAGTFTYCCLRGKTGRLPGVRPVLAVLTVTTAIIFICMPPGLPAVAVHTAASVNSVMTWLFLLRITLCLVLAAQFWHLFATSVGVRAAIRWWPMALILLLVAMTVAFILLSSNEYRRIVLKNLLATTRNAAAAIPLDALGRAAEDRGSANDPAVAEEVFGSVRRLDLFVGYATVASRADALYFLPRERVPVAVLDVFGHPGTESWAVEGLSAAELWREVEERGYGVHRGPTELAPLVMVAAIPDRSGAPAGAAVLTYSMPDLFFNMYLFRRLVLLFLTPAFFILLLLLSRQQRAWLASHSTSRVEALRLGALGNELTAVMILRDDVVVDVNQRCCDLAGVERQELIGASVGSLFATAAADTVLPAGPARPDNAAGATTMEMSITRPDGQVVHLLVYGRPLSDNPGDRHVIWESVDISHAKEMEREARQGKDKLQLVLDHLPAAVFVKDHRGRYVMANRAFATVFGLESTDDVLHRTAVEVLREGYALSHANDEIAVDMNGETLVYDQIIVRLDGSERHIEVSKAVRRFGEGNDDYLVVGSVHDFTDRKRVQDAILSERHFLHQLIDSLPLSVCFIDSDRKIRLANTDFCREAGADGFQDLVGQPFDTVAPYGSEAAEDDLRLLTRSSGYSDTEFTVTKNGRERAFMLRRIPMADGNGHTLGLIKAYWDTTAIVRAKQAAAPTDAGRSVFLADVSRELGTPLNGIVGMASLVVEHEGVPPVVALYGETIIKSAKILQLVLDVIIDSTSAVKTRDRDGPFLEPFPILALAEEAVQVAACVVEGWGARLHFLYDYDLHSFYAGDARRFRRAVTELVITCGRMTEDGNLTLRLSSTGLRDDGRVVVQTLFRPAAGTTAEKVAGELASGPDSGRAGDDTFHSVFDAMTGLPLAARLVEAMGGSIAVECRDGLMCCEAVLPMTSGGSDQAAAPLTPPDLSALRVLVATADPTRAEAIRACLEYAGARTCVVPSLDEAKKTGRTAAVDGDRFTLFVVDAELLPENSVADWMPDPDPEAIPPAVILASSLNQTHHAVADSGVDGVVVTPVCPSELWYKAAAVARRHNPASAQPACGRAAAPAWPTLGASVLLVEDNPVNQMVGMNILRRLGCLPVLAANGVEAVEKVEQGGRYDIVLMDCAMPEMDGYQATSRIRLWEREGKNRSRTPIIALTASSADGDREKCLAAGMDDFVTKPVTVDLIRRAIQTHCPQLGGTADLSG